MHRIRTAASIVALPCCYNVGAECCLRVLGLGGRRRAGRHVRFERCPQECSNRLAYWGLIHVQPYNESMRAATSVVSSRYRVVLRNITVDIQPKKQKQKKDRKRQLTVFIRRFTALQYVSQERVRIACRHAWMDVPVQIITIVMIRITCVCCIPIPTSIGGRELLRVEFIVTRTASAMVCSDVLVYDYGCAVTPIIGAGPKVQPLRKGKERMRKA